MVGTPPPISASSDLLPVDIYITFDLTCENSVAVMKEADWSLEAVSLSLSTFASESPLILQRFLRVVICIALTVHIPALLSLVISAAPIPWF